MGVKGGKKRDGGTRLARSKRGEMKARTKGGEDPTFDGLRVKEVVHHVLNPFRLQRIPNGMFQVL